jgi:hypothetical protein
MLTHQKKARRSPLHQVNRAGGQVAARAQGALSGAGEVARSAGAGVVRVPRRVRHGADRTVWGARRAAAGRLSSTASRLSSVADVVEHGRRPRRRRWPFVAAAAAVLTAAGVVATKVARSLRSRDTSDTEGRGDGQRGNGDESPRPEAMDKTPAPGEPARRAEPAASRTPATSGTGTASRRASPNNNDGR